jgi:hypothetical protein
MLIEETVKIHVPSFEEEWARDMAKQIQEEIDRDIVDSLVKYAEDNKKPGKNKRIC